MCRLKHKWFHWLKGLLWRRCNGDFCVWWKWDYFFFFKKEYSIPIWYPLYWSLKVHFSLWFWLETKENFAFSKAVHLYLLFGIVTWLNYSFRHQLSVYNAWQNLVTSMNEPVFLWSRGLKQPCVLILILKEVIELNWQRKLNLPKLRGKNTQNISAGGSKC